MNPSRRSFVGGNWKATCSKAKVDEIVERLNGMSKVPDGVDLWVSPSAIHVASVAASVRPEVAVGVQNIHTADGYGAYTGELTADMVKESGIQWVLVGHSERRNLFGETVESAGEKAALALSKGMSVLFCIGEHLEDRESGRTMDILTAQLNALVSRVSTEQWSRIVLAYEPTWAIGTGQVATPDQAQEVHASLREWLSANVSPDVAESLRIIYGGSVKGTNAGDLAELPDVDGFLVGGASLKPNFMDMVKHLNNM